MLVAAFRKPIVILIRNTVTSFKNYLNFAASSPAYGTLNRITCCFLNATTTGCKFYCGFRKNHQSVFIEEIRSLKVPFLAIKMKTLKTICDHTESTNLLL
jgi:hypothetical protein